MTIQLPDIHVNNVMQYIDDLRCVEVMYSRWDAMLTESKIEPISPTYSMVTVSQYLGYYADLSSYFDTLWGIIRLHAGTIKHRIALRDTLEVLSKNARFKYEAVSRIISSYEILMREAQNEKRY